MSNNASYYNQVGKTIAVFGTIGGSPPEESKDTTTTTVIKHSIKSGIEDLSDVAIVDREYFDHLVRSRETMDLL